jgi:hypothetical protein
MMTKIEIITTISIMVGTTLVLHNSLALAQITSAIDCSETPEFKKLVGINQTREEMIALMDEEFVEKISKQDSCRQINNTSDGGSDAGGGGGNGGSAGGGGTSGQGAGQTIVIAAPNQVQAGESSVSLDKNLSLLGSSGQNPNDFTSADNGLNGRSEMDLVQADADAQLLEDLKKQIDEEQDPQIKANLEEMLKDLEK